MDLILIVAFLISFIFIKCILFKYKDEPKNFPPGPRSYLPVIGGLIKTGMEPCKVFLKERKILGNIFAFDFGSKRIVVLNNYKIIKEAMARFEFSGRKQSKVYLLRQANQEQNGILLNDINQTWMDHRRFVMKNLGNLGFSSKDAMQSLLEIELHDLIEKINSVQDGPMVFKHELQICMFGIITSVVTGNRLDSKDPRVLKLLNTMTEDFEVAYILYTYPWLFKFRKFIPLVSKYIENCTYALTFVQNEIDHHKYKFEENSLNNLIDRYLFKMKHEGNTNSSFFGIIGDKNLTTVVNDLYLAGTESTSTVLSWVFHTLALKQDIQEKIFEEINSKIGLDTSPKLTDRPKLLYIEAFVMEMLRYATIAPGLLHNTTVDIMDFYGYHLPKDTTILVNIEACLHDPEYWEKPEEFKPERFLSEDGLTLLKHEPFIPFFSGKRLCIGENLARDVLFLFTANIIQSFKIRPHPSLKPVPTKVDYICGVTNLPISFPLQFEKRFA